MEASFLTTYVTYTPTWAFSSPWILPPTQTGLWPVTLSLEANKTAVSIAPPLLIGVTFTGSDGGTSHTSRVLTTSSIAKSDGTTIQSTFTSWASSSSGVHPSAKSSSDAVATGQPSTPASGSQTPTRTTSYTVKGHTRLPSGQTAGLAIGCIAVGAAIATLVACCFISRKRKSKGLPSARNRSMSSTSDDGIDKRSSPMIWNRIERPPACTALDTLLAKPTPGDDIIAMFTHLNTSIAEYVQKYMDGDNRSTFWLPTYR